MLPELKLLAFALGSAGIIFISWMPLHQTHSHGFYRFFAFESVLALVLLNIEHWFADPFSPPQLVSWLLLIGSLVLAVQGFYLLLTLGSPTDGVEKTTALVTRGAYKYIRHPLYSSLLLLGWGAFLKDVSLFGGVLVFIVTVLLVATAKVEEGENLVKFGDGYAAYCKTTKMFLPYLF